MPGPPADTTAVPDPLHVVNLTGTQQRRYTAADFDAPYAQAADHGWAAAAIRQGTALTVLLVTDPDQSGVAIVSESLRAHGLAAAFSRFPARHLEHAFTAEASAPQRTAAWDRLRRLHELTPTIPDGADEIARRAWLSWANLPARDAVAWRAAGVTSGVNAHYYATNGFTPTQIGTYVGDGAYRPFRWHRADVALYARHGLSLDDALAWSHLGFPLAVTTAFLDCGYGTTEAETLDRTVKRRDRTAEGARTGSALINWIRPDIPAALAPVAVAAGLTPDEAAAGPDLDTLRALAALRTARLP